MELVLGGLLMSRMSVAGTDVVISANPYTTNTKGNSYQYNTYSPNKIVTSNVTGLVENFTHKQTANISTSSISNAIQINTNKTNGASIPPLITAD